MDNNDIKIFIKWTAPIALILTPLLFIIVIIKIISEKGIAGLTVDIFTPDFIFIASFCFFGFMIAFYYCKKELGWFGGQ